MRVTISGEIVDTDRNEWNFNGRSGVAYALLIRADGTSPGSAASRVKVSAEQYGGFTIGEHVDLPVDVFANTVERGGAIMGAKLSTTLADDYAQASGLRSASSL